MPHDQEEHCRRLGLKLAYYCPSLKLALRLALSVWKLWLVPYRASGSGSTSTYLLLRRTRQGVRRIRPKDRHSGLRYDATCLSRL